MFDLRFYVGNKAMEEKCLNELSFYQQQELVRKFEHCCCIINLIPCSFQQINIPSFLHHCITVSQFSVL